MTARRTRTAAGKPAHPPDHHPVFADGLFVGHHLLEADAGTGKTWTLAGLFVRALIEARLDADRILVVTFTRAASAELKARIADLIVRLQQAFEARRDGREVPTGDPFVDHYPSRCPLPSDEAIAVLRVAATELDRASIQTIHGFCRRALGEFPLALGLPAGVEVVDRTAGGIRPEIARWWREQTVGHPDPAWSRFLLSTTRLEFLVNAVRMARMRPGIDIGDGVLPWAEWWPAWEAAHRALVDAFEDEALRLQDWLARDPRVNRQKMRSDNVANWLGQIAAVADDGPSVQTCPAGLEKLGTDNLTLSFKGSTAELEQCGWRLPALCDRLRTLYSIRGRVIAAQLPVLLERLDASIAGHGARSGRIDADQLLLLMRDSLARGQSGVRLAQRLADRHPLALIDECQDNDPLQWEILNAIYPPSADARPGLILVGDPKQTIYDFRGADVFAYLDAAAHGRRRHRLGENQRASQAVLDGLNRLFGRDRPFLVDGLRFEPAVEGTRPRSQLVTAHGEPAIAWRWVEIDAPGDDQDEDADEDQDARVDRCAQAVAAEIDRLLGPRGERIIEPGKPGEPGKPARPVRPADIAVLVSSHVEGHRMKLALAARSIGAVQLGQDSVLASPEAEDLRRLIAAIDDPAAGGLLRGALVTVTLGVDAVRLQAISGDASEWAATVERFALARRRWLRSGPQAALRGLLRDFDAFERLAGTDRGERALTNLLHLLDLLGRSPDAAAGPAHALRWFARQDDVAPVEEAELRLESDERLVHILTVHKSKGLEYPIVFVPFSWRMPKGPARLLLVHEHDGSGWRARLWLDRLPADAKARADLEARSEALRRLYVAVTRATLRVVLFWGAVGRAAGRSPIAWLLHGADDVERPVTVDEQAVDGALSAFVDALPGVADRVTLTSMIEGGRRAGGESNASAAAPTANPLPPARVFGRLLPAPWQRKSFTLLTRADPGLSIDRPEHDEFDAVAMSVIGESMATGVIGTLAPRIASDAGTFPRAPAGEAEHIRWRFPAGAEAGTCLHAILEGADFTQPIRAADAEPRLRRSGFDPDLASAVADWLSDVLSIRLAVGDEPGPRLSEIAPAGTLRELGFSLAASPVRTRALIDRVRRDYPITTPFDSDDLDERWSGYLRGFIDLVVRDRDRYWIVDWKSNHLGSGVEAYTPAAIGPVMARHAYPLQFALYTLALHRLLRARVPDYDYDRMIGGVAYVFLRGAGLSAPMAGDPPGVVVTRPPRRLVEDLDEMLRGGPAVDRVGADPSPAVRPEGHR